MDAHKETTPDPSHGLLAWLRTTLATYVLEPVAVYRPGASQDFPVFAENEAELQNKLNAGGHFLPLPREPAALANVLEVAIVDFLIRAIGSIDGATITRGTERGYPDVEIGGVPFGGGFHAIDVKVARRAKSGNKTNSRITLYTGNTYFRYPQLKWPGTFRPFQDYASHLDVIALYTLNQSSLGRIDDLEILVHEPWRIASKKRSSTTREYLGAVERLDDLRAGQGEFSTDADFYNYWRGPRFKVGRAVQQQLDKLLRPADIPKKLPRPRAGKSSKNRGAT